MQMRILRVICDKNKFYRVKNYKYFELTTNSKRTQESKEANGKAKKSAGRMPWHWEPKKDAINCDKPRGAVSTL